MIKNILGLLGFLLLTGCKAQQKSIDISSNEDDNSLLWEISGNGISTPSYLFGTFHMMCKDDIHFSEGMNRAMKNASEIYFEMDLDDAANTLGAVFFMNMKNGTTLKDLYTDEEYARLENYFTDSLGMGLQMMQRMKPYFLQAMILPKLMPCKNMSGVEQELMKIAKEQKKEVKGLETIAFQASVFDSIPYQVQAKELLKGIDSMTDYRPYFDSMLDVYKSQRLGDMEKLINNDQFGMAENTDLLLDKRNKNWVEQMKKILPEKNVFFAVGAGHLVGENGLISLLKKEGYKLRPLKN